MAHALVVTWAVARVLARRLGPTVIVEVQHQLNATQVQRDQLSRGKVQQVVNESTVPILQGCRSARGSLEDYLCS